MPHMSNLPWIEMYLSMPLLFYIFLSNNFMQHLTLTKQQSMNFKSNLSQWKW